MANHCDREHFIPLRKADLVERLCATGLGPDEETEFRQLCRLIEATFHYEFHQKLESLKNMYAPFDPDADTVLKASARPSLVEQEKRIDRLIAELTWLLEKANFKRLTWDDIIKSVRDPSGWGLNLDVDFKLFDRLEVFVRGDFNQQRRRRRFRRLLRQEIVDVPMYQRLAVLLRLRPHKRLGPDVDTQSIFLKLFKEIPKLDLEMFLPGSKARMSLADRMKISFPTLTGLGLTGWKASTGALALAKLAGPVGWVLAAGGTLGYGIRSFFGYQNTKKKYQLTLTESLYFQNLDNNAGVLFRLLDEAEEQECREAMLAYFFLWRESDELGWTEEELDDRIEKFLEATMQLKVDFEVTDALGKLVRLKLVEELPGPRFRAVAARRSLEILDHAWDGYFEYNSVAS